MTQDKYVGALVGLTVAFPLLGRFGHFPASIIGVIIPLIACLMVWRNLRLSLLIYISLGVFLILILQATQRSQFQFLAHPALWLDHSSRYFQSKLMMFLIAFLPVGLAAVVASSFSGETRDRLTGILWSFILVAIAGFARTIPWLHLLIATPEAVSTPFFDANSRGFSVVSLGILFLFGAISALALERTWPLAAVFGFLAFWFNRKTEFILISAAIVAFSVWRSGLNLRKMHQLGTSAAIIAVLAFALHNDSNIVTWRLLMKSAASRTEVVAAAAEGQKAVTVSDEHLSSIIVPEAQQDAPAPTKGSSSISFGHGLGWYSTLGGTYLYPHNSLVELYLETGLFSMILFLIVALAGIFISIYEGVRLRRIEFVALGVMTLGFFLVCMKAGEITLSARLFALSLIGLALVRPARPTSARSLKDAHGARLSRGTIAADNKIKASIR